MSNEGFSVRLRRRDEHGTRGDSSPPRWDALLRSVADQQPGGDGLRQPAEGQPRRSPGDGQAEGPAAGEAGVHHVGSTGQRQQLLLNETVADPASVA